MHAQAYHLKAAGQKNWPKMSQAIAKIDAAHVVPAVRHGRAVKSQKLVEIYPTTE